MQLLDQANAPIAYERTSASSGMNNWLWCRREKKFVNISLIALRYHCMASYSGEIVLNTTGWVRNSKFKGLLGSLQSGLLTVWTPHPRRSFIHVLIKLRILSIAWGYR